MKSLDRRQFLRLAGTGCGAVFLSGLGFEAIAGKPKTVGTRQPAMASDFYFVQMSDTHWGYQNAGINPEAAHTLPRAIAAVNGLKHQPDFIVFTGDLTHTTDDPAERRRRMAEFRSTAAALRVKNLKFLPGEHDASLDRGEAYGEFFGPLHYSFDHKGVHFIALDNVSNPELNLGDAQLEWLEADLRKLRREIPIVVFTHRPLFDLYRQWDWYTRDGQAAIDLLTPYRNVAVFYGHIHQLHRHQTGHISHYAAQSLIFPLPAPGSAPRRTPLPWNPAQPFQDLGVRQVAAHPKTRRYDIENKPLI